MKSTLTLLRSACLFLLLLLSCLSTHGQSTSNKGRDFWIGYMAHIDGNASKMSLYVTSDRNTVVQMTIGNQAPTTHNVTANQVTVIAVDPILAHITSSEVIEQKAVHLTSNVPVVVYSHIYSRNRSGATLVLPSNTLGRSYYAISYDQYRPSNNQTSQLMVVALEDNTTIEITPTAATRGGNPAGVPFRPSKPLMKGELYQVRALQDLSGSKIESIDTGLGSCKRIAVFSGSSWTAIPVTCSPGNSGNLSGDNLYQQLYPVSAWGKNFVTAPFKSRQTGDIFRVLASEDNTSVTINGNAVTLDKGKFYEFESDQPNYVTANKPILFAQYAKTQDCDGVPADPEMTLVNPVEQTLKDITLYSSSDFQIARHYINVTMKSQDTATFRLDGKKVRFFPISANPAYAYTQNDVNAGNHTLKADSGFNAVAYGFGQVESYGYSAGANVNNLLQNITVLSDSICDGRNIRFKGFAAYQPLAWKWYFGDGATSEEQSPSHVFPGPGTYNVSLVTTKSNGNDCDSQDSTYIEVEVFPNPQVGFSFTTVCSNDSTRFLDESQLTTGETIRSWRWDFGDGTTSSKQHPAHRFKTPGTYQVKLSITNQNLCVSEITKEVIIYAPPVVKFTAANVCDGKSMVFQNNSTLAQGTVTRWEWNFGDGSTLNTEQNPLHVFPQAGTYQVKLKATSDQGCTDSVQVAVVVNPKPVVAFSLPDICIKDEAVFQNQTTLAAGSMTYLWNFGDGKTSTAAQPRHKYTAEGIYTVKLVVTTALGCKDSLSNTYTVSGAVPVAAFSTSSFCQEQGVQFKDESAIAFGNIVRHRWDFGDGTFSEEKQPLYVYAKAGTYQVNLQVWSGIVCTDATSRTITVLPNPVAGFTAANACVGTGTRFTNTSTAAGSGTLSFAWDFGDGKSSTEPSPTHMYANPGTYTVTLVAKGTNTCEQRSTQTLTIYPTPTVDAGPDFVLVEGESVTLQGTGQGTLSWSPGMGLSSTSIGNPVVTPLATTKYYLTATFDTGCSNKDSLEIKVLKKLQIPKAFSPNGDNVNDLWELGGIEDYPRISIEVYNRWGQLVYSSKNNTAPWDGKRNGSDLPIGAYYYIIDPNNGRPKVTGPLTILR